MKVVITTSSLDELIDALEFIKNRVYPYLGYLHIEHIEGTDKIEVTAKTEAWVEEEKEQ